MARLRSGDDTHAGVRLLLFLGRDDDLHIPIKCEEEPKESVNREAAQATPHEGRHLRLVNAQDFLGVLSGICVDLQLVGGQRELA